MSYKNHLIEAATDLGLTTSGVYYKINNDCTAILSSDETETITVNAAIISRATYLEKLIEIRTIRNQRLTESDWRVGVDSPLSDEEKAVWIAYRQSLRDCTGTLVEGSEDEFEYPASPLASST